MWLILKQYIVVRNKDKKMSQVWMQSRIYFENTLTKIPYILHSLFMPYNDNHLGQMKGKILKLSKQSA